MFDLFTKRYLCLLEIFLFLKYLQTISSVFTKNMAILLETLFGGAHIIHMVPKKIQIILLYCIILCIYYIYMYDYIPDSQPV